MIWDLVSTAAGVPEEELEQGELLRGQLELGAGPPGLFGGGIQLEVPFGQHDRTAAVVPPGEGPQPGRELQQAERLDQVIVRAGVKARGPGHRPRRGR